MEITLSDLWKILKKCIFVMIACAVLLGGITYAYVSTRVQKVYSTSFSVGLRYAGPGENGEDVGLESFSQFIAVGNALLIGTMPRFESESMAEVILAELDPAQNPNYDRLYGQYGYLEHKYSSTTLAGLIDSQFLDINNTVTYHMNVRFTVKAYSSNDCGLLALALKNCLNPVMHEYSQGLYEFDTLSNVYSGSRVAPNAVGRATVMGAVGFVAPYVIALALCLLDRKVYTEEDLKRRYEKYAVLGQIPKID